MRLRKEVSIEDKKKTVQMKGIEKINSYFDLDLKSLKKTDPIVLKHLHNMAKIGLQFEKEVNLTRRATEMNYVRVGKLISENKKELKAYLLRTLPSYK